MERNSWFTEALSEYVKQPALTLELNEVFTKVKKRVSDATEGRQTPWTISSLTSGFYFHAPLNQETENDPTLAEKWFDDAQRREQREDWAEALDLIDRFSRRSPAEPWRKRPGKSWPTSPHAKKRSSDSMPATTPLPPPCTNRR
jgi:uncharacterized caspase-like protein